MVDALRLPVQDPIEVTVDTPVDIALVEASGGSVPTPTNVELPPGLTFRASDRHIIGTATETGVWQARYTVSDFQATSLTTEFVVSVVQREIPALRFRVSGLTLRIRRGCS